MIDSLRAIADSVNPSRDLTWPRLSPRWYVLAIEPGLDALARRALDFIGVIRREFTFKVELPRTHRAVLRPWLPGYQFVSLDLDADPWGRVAAAPGVAGILGDGGGTPTPLRPGEMERLEGELPFRPPPDVLGRLVRVIRVGAVVRVANGPFAGFQGTCLACDGRTIRFDMEIFGRSGPVIMETTDVEIA